MVLMAFWLFLNEDIITKLLFLVTEWLIFDAKSCKINEFSIKEKINITIVY